jgi:uncharacterized ion transporter superfamily protein YfcC
MNTHRLLNAALAIACIAAWMVIAGMFDRELLEGDLRHSKDAQVEKRRNQAAMRICGNAHATWQDATTLVCQRHTGRGKPVVTAGVLL